MGLFQALAEGKMAGRGRDDGRLSRQAGYAGWERGGAKDSSP